jgi:DNA-binding transcriptional ArsR family regulator
MPQEEAEETYSVIYSALKHPIRRRILRMLNDNELSYTQMLKTLDIATSHLNYYLENLGELVVKTADGKYRLSELGKAAVNLMLGIEETEPAPNERTKSRFSRRKITRLSQVLSIVALVLVGVLLISMSNYSEYFNDGSAGPLGLQTLQPNASLTTNVIISLRDFPTNTLTSYYKTFLQTEIIQTNVTLQVQVTESVYPMGNIPIGAPVERYFEDSVLIYNQTCPGPLLSEGGPAGLATTGDELLVPIQSPQEKGVLSANSFAYYNITITNLGEERIVAQPSGNFHIVREPDNGSFSMKTSYVFIQKTDYFYFYHGFTLIVFALALAALPYLPLLVKRFRKSP